MVEVNWNYFKYQFNNREQDTFEWFCYLLFCKEFGKEIGVSGYKNHAGIEKNPIHHGKEVIGFQAKFLESADRINKRLLVGAIKRAKNNHPQITKIIFYINNEFGQGKGGGDPKYKVETEQEAKSLEVNIEWRMKDYFDSPFVTEKCENISVYFFSERKGILELIKEVSDKTDEVLSHISTKIELEGSEIKIPHQFLIEKLKTDTDSRNIIISGEGGVGKTALIKDLYLEKNVDTPFFLFKVNEFNQSRIQGMYPEYLDINLLTLLEEFPSKEHKVIVIDSAERISDIKNRDVLIEFMNIATLNNWQIIYTCRDRYLNDLKFIINQIFEKGYEVLSLKRLTKQNLENLSNEHGFTLPQSERLVELLCIPFYLNEFLSNIEAVGEGFTIDQFKEILWHKLVSKSDYRESEREKCFLYAVHHRSINETFFIELSDFSKNIIDELQNDNLLGYDPNVKKYFIAHDIYEEWALEKIISSNFGSQNSEKSFFDSIGSSLSIRRSFRQWLSDKLLEDNLRVISLVDNSFFNEELEPYWKDEILVSVLLSEYSEKFVNLFESKFIENEYELLKRAIFFLRIACKKIDKKFEKLINPSVLISEAFSIPSGSGWSTVISFIYSHLETIPSKLFYTILPLIYDWNKQLIPGETTAQASKIAIKYYLEITGGGGFSYSYPKDQKDKLFQTILFGAEEAKTELSLILGAIIKAEDTSHTSQHYEFVKEVLSSSLYTKQICKALPKQIINLAELFWVDESVQDRHSSMGPEKYYGLIDKFHFGYHPPSAYQTPIYWLLKFHPGETLPFILKFTNQAIKHFAESAADPYGEWIEIKISEKVYAKQFLSDRLWQMHRGAGVVTPYLLQSIHMALEKWLLEIAKIIRNEDLQFYCLYLIKSSNSISVTSVVCSLVLAYPEKLFSIAKILLQIREFLFLETRRWLQDKSIKSLYSIGIGINQISDIYTNERIATCEDDHRKLALEHIITRYQFFREKEVTEEEANKRQEELWAIFDSYYSKLDAIEQQTEEDKTWRLFLARMDRRKMNPKIEDHDDGVLLDFNPEVDQDLQEFSAESLKESEKAMKDSSLWLWAKQKFDRQNDGIYSKEFDDPSFVINEVKRILDKANDETYDFREILGSTFPGIACSILIRDQKENLSKEQIDFCTEVILQHASLALGDKYYTYMSQEGIESSCSVLPILYKESNDIEIFKLILLILLSHEDQIQIKLMNSVFEVLSEENSKDIERLLFGFIKFKSSYDEIFGNTRKAFIENRIENRTGTYEQEVLDTFLDRNGDEIESQLFGSEDFEIVKVDYENLSRHNLLIAFQLLPKKLEREDQIEFALFVIQEFSRKVFLDRDELDYSIILKFFQVFSSFILFQEVENVRKLVKPLCDNFELSNYSDELFRELVTAEDIFFQYEQFWIVWHEFYPIIKRVASQSHRRHYADKVVEKYLLVTTWKDGVKKWRSIEEREKDFFNKICLEIGSNPAVLYSISKFLNDIGSIFLNDGVFWIARIINTNEMSDKELIVNTTYYLELILKKYIYLNRSGIKTDDYIKHQILIILDFLINKGSMAAYRMREDIL